MIPQSNQDPAALLGVRYIGCGMREGTVELTATPGNALGAYLDGGRIVVRANAQDATGDTMNRGEIIIHGSTGDAAGYAMRGGCIYVKDRAGYRAGIHMKEYGEHRPVIVIGASAGSFLGEYQAGGVILVLGLGVTDRPPVGAFCATGMHGGRIYLRTEHLPCDLPAQVVAEPLSDTAEIAPYVARYCELFGGDAAALLADRYYVLRANTHNPYRQLYVAN